MNNSEQTLWEKIKNGEYPFIDVIDMPVGMFNTFEVSAGEVHCTKSKNYKTISTLTTLTKLENNQDYIGCKIFIYPSSKDSPYWTEKKSFTDPHDFTQSFRMVDTLRIGRVKLTRKEQDFEYKQYEGRMKDKKKVGRENNRRLLLTRI